MSDLTCPCGSDKDYQLCCDVFHQQFNAPTAEKLMRSRYSAYVLELENYLLQTWHPSTRPAQLNLQQEGKVNWLGLKIIRCEAGNNHDNTGVVEFVARYKANSKATRLHETSQFVQEQGQWLYLSGQAGTE